MSKRKRRIRTLFRRSKKRLLRYGLLVGNILLLAGATAFVLQSPTTNEPVRQYVTNASPTVESAVANPLDQLSSADIAVHVARMAGLAEASSVANNADSVNAQLSITPADDKIVAKPQVVTTALKSKKDIASYVVKDGETISKIAEKFGITSDSIRWSNGLTGDVVAVGKELTIPPVTGIVYTVKDGDTPDSLAQKYSASKDQIIVFNDAEVAGLKAGERIVVPDGKIQAVRAVATTGSVAGAAFAWGGYAPIYGSNGYDYGYCTWWAAVRRQQVGKTIPSNLGHARTWKDLAQRAGLGVGNVPQQYAVIWTPLSMSSTWYGHVGFVEEVFADGSIRVSDMNVAGWNRVSSRTLNAQQAAAYGYIY